MTRRPPPRPRVVIKVDLTEYLGDERRTTGSMTFETTESFPDAVSMVGTLFGALDTEADR